MKKIFEEPTLECVKVINEPVTGDFPGAEGGWSSISPWG